MTTRHDMLVELASDQVSQVQELFDENDYASVHSWLQPLFLRELYIALADMSDDDLQAHYCDQMGVDIPSSPPLSLANAKETDTDEVLSQAEESERRSMPSSSELDNLAVSLIHSICNAPRVGKVAAKGTIPSAGETPVHWY